MHRARRDLAQLLERLGRQHHVLPARHRDGCAARAARARPRSAPGRRRAGRRRSSGRPASDACSRAARAARVTCSGPSRNWAVTVAGSRSEPPSPFSVTRHMSSRSGTDGCSSSKSSGTSVDQAGSHVRAPVRTTGQPASASSRIACTPSSTSASTGPAISPASWRRASRTAASAAAFASSAEARRDRSTATVRLPSSENAAEATARPEAAARSRR